MSLKTARRDTRFMVRTTSMASAPGVLKAYVITGLLFMLVPGTLWGVLNLIQVSTRESVALVSPAWLQAHGHAQIFGWIGTFILGIGFYSLPSGRSGTEGAIRLARMVWLIWTIGVAARWVANVYEWQWRVLLPLSAVLELAAFLIFLRIMSRHRPADPSQGVLQPWILVVMTGVAGWFLALAANLALCIDVAIAGGSPALTHSLDQRFLVLVAWGFLAPVVWGFSLRWLPVFVGLRPSRPFMLPIAIGVNLIGVVFALIGSFTTATTGALIAATAMAIALGIFEPAVAAAKIRGVHRSFPLFVRVAYAWLLIAALLGCAAVRFDTSGGIWGASRHAFTVGFVTTMVFAIGQRVLPEFAALRPLWSPTLMVACLTLIEVGCAVRVSSEVLAYQSYAAWAWHCLPVSAVIELVAVIVFAINLLVTLTSTTRAA